MESHTPGPRFELLNHSMAGICDRKMTGTPAVPRAERMPLLRPSVLVLIVANLVPILGVVWFRWEVFPLVFLFWFENVIVGVFNVLRMLLAMPQHGLGWAAKLFMIPFFCFHYGMFTFVHGVFVIGLFGGGFRHGAPFPDEHAILQLVIEKHLTWAILGLAISHGFSFAYNYLWLGEFRRAALPVLMQQPYSRVVVLHLAILGGGFLMAALGSPVAGLVLLVLLKIVVDVRAHLRERQKLATLHAAPDQPKASHPA
jgi:hypothetical protein